MAYNYLREAESIRNYSGCSFDSSSAYEVDWDTNGDVDGWDSYSLVHTYGVWNNVLFGTSYGGNCYISRTAYFSPVAAEDYYFLRIQMKLSATRDGSHITQGKVQWIKDGDILWDDDKSAEFDVVADDKWRYYDINLGPEQWWQGDIRNLRIFPFLHTRTGDRFFIRSISIISPSAFSCTNPTCSFYSSYEHSCQGVGTLGYCLGTSIGTTDIVEDVNDELIVNIDDYGDQYITLKSGSGLTVQEIAREIERQLVKVDIGGYVNATAERDADRIKINSGTAADDSSVVVKHSQLAEDLGFFSGATDISTKVTGTDPATGFEHAASYRLKGVELNKLVNSDTTETAFYHDPSRYEVEAGRVDWQQAVTGLIEQDVDHDYTDEYYTVFDGEGTTVVDYTHPFNSDGRVTKVQVMGYPKEGEAAKLKIFRPKMNGELELVLEESFGTENGSYVYSVYKDTFEVDVDLRVRKGDLVGFYNMNLYLGNVIGEDPDALLFYISGDATGTFSPGELQAYGSFGLNFYARSDRRQDLALISIDLGNRVNAKSLLFYGEELAEDFEYNVAICEDINWNVNLFGGTHTHAVDDNIIPENSYTATHQNIAYGTSLLGDGITFSDGGLAGTSYGFSSGSGFYTSGGETYFYINGDAEWLNMSPGEDFGLPRYTGSVPTDFATDPIQFKLTFPEEQTFSHTRIYFKERKNFYNFGWAYFVGEYQYIGNYPQDLRYQYIPAYTAVIIDGNRWTPETAPEDFEDYIFSNPTDARWSTGETVGDRTYLDPDTQVGGLSLLWNVLEHEFEPITTRSIVFYTDWHDSTKIYEMEVYATVANEPSLLDDVYVQHSREGDYWNTSVFEDTIIDGQEVTAALIQDNPRYITLEIRSSSVIRYKEFELLLEEDNVYVGDTRCQDELQMTTTRRGAPRQSQYIDIWNEFEVPATLTVDIPTEDDVDRVVLWSKLNSEDDVTNPDIGPGGYVFKNPDYELKNDDYQVAINNQCWALKNLADQKYFYYQYHDFGWLDWGLYSIGDNIQIAHPNKRQSAFSFTPTSATYFKFMPKNFSMYGVSEMLVSYDGDDIDFTGYREGSIDPATPLTNSETTLTDKNPTTGDFDVGDNYTVIDSFSGASIDTNNWRISNSQYLEVTGGELKTKFTSANQECYVDSFGKWMLPYDRLWRCWVSFEMDNFVAPTGTDHNIIKFETYAVQNSGHYIKIDRRINNSEDLLYYQYSSTTGGGSSYTNAVSEGFDSDFTNLRFLMYHYGSGAMRAQFYTPTYNHNWDNNRWGDEDVGWWFRLYFHTSQQAVTIPNFRVSIIYEEMPNSEGVLGASFPIHTAIDGFRVLHDDAAQAGNAGTGPVVYQSIEGDPNTAFNVADEWSVDVYTSYDNITYSYWDTASVFFSNYNLEIETYLTTDLGQRLALDYIRTYGPSATDYDIAGNTLYYNDETSDVNDIEPTGIDTGSIDDVRWPVIVIPEGEAIGKIGIYPNSEYSIAPGGGYNCEWEDIGNILTDYAYKTNVALNASISASSEFGAFRSGFVIDGVKPDGEVEKVWGSSDTTPYSEMDLGAEYDIDEVKCYWGYYTGDTQWLVTDYEFWTALSGTIDDFSGADGDAPNSDKWTGVVQAEIENNSLKIWSTTSAHGHAYLDTDIGGDFSAFVTYSGTFPNIHDYSTSLRVVDPVSSGIVQVGRSYDNFTHFYIMQYYDGSWNTIDTVTTTDTSGKLKLERLGSVVYGYYWDDGWVEIGTSTQIGSVDAQIELWQERWEFNPEVISYFDNISVYTNKIIDITSNTDYNAVHSLSNVVTCQNVLVQILGYDAGSMIVETGDGTFETFAGSFCREIELLETKGEYFISSEDYPIVAVDLGYKFIITAHDVTTPYPDYPDSLWDNSNSKFRYSDSFLDDPQKIEFTALGASLPRDAKWILANDTDFISAGVTTYKTDFSEYTLYSAPSDWYAHYPPGGYVWEITDVVDNPLPASDRVMLVDVGNDDYRFIWEDVPLTTDVEVLALVLTPTEGVNSSPAIVARGSRTWDLGDQQGFWSSVGPNGDVVILNRYIPGDFYSNSWSVSAGIDGESWYWIRMRLEGNTQYLKAWKYGDSEPGSWDGTDTVADLNEAGWVGVYHSTNYWNAYYAYFSAGIGGSSAPHPDDPEIDEIEQAVTGGVNFLDNIEVSSAEKYRITRFPWWWQSTHSTLTDNYTYIRPDSAASVQIDYTGGVTTSGIDEIIFIEGTNFGTDERFSEMDYLSFWLYVPDPTKLADYGEVTFGDYDEPRYHSWDISTTVVGFSTGWNNVLVKFRDADTKINVQGDPTYSADWTDLNNYEDLELKSFRLMLRGKGDPFTVYLDDVRIERNTFHDDVKFGKGLYLAHSEYAVWPLSEFDPHKGTIEFWMRPDFNFYGTDSFFRTRSRTIFAFTNVANDIFGLFFRKGSGPALVVGNSEGMVTEYATPTVNTAFVNNDIVHVGFLWSNDGTAIHSSGITAAIFINGWWIAFSKETWEIRDKKSTRLIIGGAVPQAPALQDPTSAWASIDNLKVYNYCKKDFLDKEIEDPEFSELLSPNEFIEISSDNVIFYNRDSSALPLTFEQVPVDESRRIWVRTNIPISLTGKEKRTADLQIEWLRSF